MKAGQLVLVALLALGAVAMLGELTLPAHEQTPQGAPLPPLHLTQFNGSPLDFDALRTPYILIHFWASWCAPCRAEMPKLAALAAAHPQSLSLVLITVDEKVATAQALLDSLDARSARALRAPNVRLTIDAKRRAAQQFAVYQFPESYLVGPERRLLQKFVGALSTGDFSLPQP